MPRLTAGLCLLILTGPLPAPGARADEPPPGITRVYDNRLVPIADPRPLLADHPRFVAPVTETARFEAPMLIDDPDADLEVRGWRFSYNARGIIEVPNRLRGDRTAIIVVHPWGIDDGQGWRTPEPAGVAFQCTPRKNAIVLDHAAQVINPFLKSLRGKVALVAYSLPGKGDPIRRGLYRSFDHQPTPAERRAAQQALEAKLNAFEYRGEPIPATIDVSRDTPTIAYFQQFPGIDSSARYNAAGYWDLPVPVTRAITVALDDLVAYDAEGYPALRDFLKAQGIRHILLAGYNTDMCVCETTAGYKNLRQDFDVFLVGDATIATFPAQPGPALATNAAVAYAALNLFITQASWVRPIPASTPGAGAAR
jgi:nicotinamidase-related amidase